MAKGHKRIFPKKPEKLNQNTAKKLGVNSNLAGYKASKEGIYFREKKTIGDSLTLDQRKRLDSLRKTLSRE